MTQKSIIITGATGSIGQGLCKGFKDKGWRVIGTDYAESCNLNIDSYISIDLDRLCKDSLYCKKCIKHIKNECSGGLDALINNAAIQILESVENLTFKDWQKTININLNSIFILIKELLTSLEMARGSVVNISSIHASLTKTNFSAYTTSKAGLVGLTKALAVELGEKVRVNALCPAAITTPMLEASFSGNQQKLSDLKYFHPTKSIGAIEDVVRASIFMIDSNNNFLNGAIINLDGGISSRLYDPE